jgi:hypothetical protein
MKSKFPGVSYDANRRKWRAVLDGKHIGYYKTEHQASLEVCRAMVEKARAADEAERLADPEKYFWRDPVDKPREWEEIEARTVLSPEFIDPEDDEGQF